MKDHAEILMNMTFAALDRIPETDRWFADEHSYEKCEFVRDEGPWIVVRWCGDEIKLDPRRVFCNPTDARVEHELLADKAADRVYEPIERDAP